jgi:hypothetical protein
MLLRELSTVNATQFALELSRHLAKNLMLTKAEIGERMISQRQTSTLPRVALVKVEMFLAVTAAVIGLWSSSSFAFGGCVIASPENPSLILGLLGAAVAALPLLRAQLKSRRRK